MINRRLYQKKAAALGIAGLALFLTTSGALAFSASVAWCSGSPSFALTDVPPGTATLQFAMTDLNVPNFITAAARSLTAGRRRCRAVPSHPASPAHRRPRGRSTLTS